MRYNTLGRSGISVSELSLGCMSLPADQRASTNIIRAAFDAGINLFDTADIYGAGSNEVILGNALFGLRDRVCICSKTGNVPRADADAGFDWDPSRKHILESIDQTLRRLQTDYLDLYLLHGGTIADDIDDTIEAFELLKKQGKIRAYGISSIRPNVIREYLKRSAIDVVMMQYSLLDRRPEEEALGLLADNGVSVLSRGALAQGLLAGKAARPYLGLSAGEVAIASTGVNISEAIGYVLHNRAVASAVTGIRTMEQLREVTAAAADTGIEDDRILELRSRVRPLVYTDHR